MKLSVSLSDQDVAYLDAYSAEQGYSSRSAALRKAVNLLRASELGPAYEQAWAEWAADEDQGVWELATSDGIS
jgi:Arc/MetJ-type ribon-helix-helix transcriptional regulator